MTDELLYRYITDQTNEDENQAVRNWIATSEDHELELARIKNIWVISGIKHEVDPIKKENEIAKILSRIKMLKNEKKKRVIPFKWIQYAAILILMMGLSGSFGYFLSNAHFGKSLGFTEIFVPKGERSQVILPDGSIVKLNSASKLKFEPVFSSGKRTILLEGEAFFQVTHDPSKPFIVKTADLEVEVLGTSFNVSSYSDDNITTTYLEEGKVQVHINGQRDITLKPSEVLKFYKSSGKSTTQMMADHRFSDWTKGILNIKGETIEELAKKLERRFDISIRFGDDEVRNHTYTGSIRDENLDTVLEALRFTSSLNYEKHEKNVTFYSMK